MWRIDFLHVLAVRQGRGNGLFVHAVPTERIIGLCMCESSEVINNTSAKQLCVHVHMYLGGTYLVYPLLP